MTKIDKVIKGLKMCLLVEERCNECPYDENPDSTGWRPKTHCITQMLEDALSILSAQKEAIDGLGLNRNVWPYYKAEGQRLPTTLDLLPIKAWIPIDWEMYERINGPIYIDNRRKPEDETEQHPRLLCVEQVPISHDLLWVELKDEEFILPMYVRGANKTYVLFDDANRRLREYNMTWRCWTACPHMAEREATPWE